MATIQELTNGSISLEGLSLFPGKFGRLGPISTEIPIHPSAVNAASDGTIVQDFANRATWSFSGDARTFYLNNWQSNPVRTDLTINGLRARIRGVGHTGSVLQIALGVSEFGGVFINNADVLSITFIGQALNIGGTTRIITGYSIGGAGETILNFVSPSLPQGWVDGTAVSVDTQPRPPVTSPTLGDQFTVAVLGGSVIATGYFVAARWGQVILDIDANTFLPPADNFPGRLGLTRFARSNDEWRITDTTAVGGYTDINSAIRFRSDCINLESLVDTNFIATHTVDTLALGVNIRTNKMVLQRSAASTAVTLTEAGATSNTRLTSTLDNLIIGDGIDVTGSGDIYTLSSPAIAIQNGDTRVGTETIKTLNFGDGVTATIDPSDSSLVNIVGEAGDGLRFLDAQGDVLGNSITSLMLGSGVSGTVSGDVGTISTVIPAGVPSVVHFEVLANPNALDPGEPQQIVRQVDNTGALIVSADPGSVADLSNIWTINHGLSTQFPLVQIYQGSVPNRQMILPDEITVLGGGSISVSFDSTTDIVGYVVISG